MNVAGAMLRRGLLPSLVSKLPSRFMASHGGGPMSKIGNREVVGFGFNGEPNYVDRVDFPMPAIRFKENTPDILALREKEKGDWRKLCIDEKKELYRASFCQTFVEMKAPTGEWKSAIGIALMFISLGMWIFMGIKVFGIVFRAVPSFRRDAKPVVLLVCSSTGGYVPALSFPSSLLVMKPLPLSYTAERQQAQLERMIALRVNPVTGLASRWDYEANDWKS